MPDTPNLIFDRKRVRQHRTRALANFGGHDFLLKEMSERLADRLGDIQRRFARVLVIGDSLLEPPGAWVVRSGADAVFDEEYLPFAPDSFDCVIAGTSLHWVNDLVGTLIQIHRLLKPDGLLLAMLPGGETLKELRQSLERAEIDTKGGVSPRVSPFVDVRDAGNLLARAGFALPVADSDMLTVEYEHPLKLMEDLRGMGQGNALMQSRKHFTSRGLLMKAAENYRRDFSNEAGRVAASFEFVTLTGWKPHASQQQPLKRGSGKIHLAEALQKKN